MRRRFSLLAMLALPATACIGDPPSDAMLTIIINANNEGADDVERLAIQAVRVDAVLSDTADGETQVETIPNAEGKVVDLVFEGGFATTTVVMPLRPSFLHQLRIIAPAVELFGPSGEGVSCENGNRPFCDSEPALGGTALARIPSGAQTGLKISPRDGEPFELLSGRVTTLVVSFSVAEQLNRPPGQGFLFRPELLADLAPNQGKPSAIVPGQVVVRFNDGVTASERDDVVAQFDPDAFILQMLFPERNLAIVSVPASKELDDAFLFFKDHASVRYTLPRILLFAEDDNPRPAGAPDDPNFENGDQDYLNVVNIGDAWDRQVGSHDVVVAVFDTGIDLDSPEFVFNLFFNEGEIPPDVTIVDADGDGIITFIDLNDPANLEAVNDVDGDGLVDGDDVRAPVNIDANGVNLGGLADGIDNDVVLIGGVPELTNVVDDLAGARIGTFPSGQGARIFDNLVDDDQAAVQATDANGHGTHVAGIIGARGNNANQIAGVAWNVRILPIKTCDEFGACDTITLSIAAMRYARRMGASIGNFSLGFTQVVQSASVEEEAVVIAQGVDLYNDGLAGDPETMLLILASGNGFDKDGDLFPDGQNCTSPRVLCAPAEFIPSNVLIVGATEADGSERASFSNFGVIGGDTDNVVPIAAPGRGITSIDRDGAVKTPLAGTSFAAPIVSGAAALLLSQDNSLSQDEIIEILLVNAQHIDALTDDFTNGNRLDIGAAVNALP